MNQFVFTGTIRARGQLTIPEKIRDLYPWVSPSSVVSIFPQKPDKVVIQPLNKQKIIDWQDIWNKIYLSRSFKGKKQNLSEFIRKDREEH